MAYKYLDRLIEAPNADSALALLGGDRLNIEFIVCEECNTKCMLHGILYSACEWCEPGTIETPNPAECNDMFHVDSARRPCG